MMNFDIEKLERKTPYKTPDHFFDAVQSKVLEQTIPKKKEAKLIPLYMKWAVAASLTLIAGLSAFFISSQNEDPVMAKNSMIIDSTYNPTQTAVADNSFEKNSKTEIAKAEPQVETKETVLGRREVSKERNNINNAPQQPKASFAKANTAADLKVNKALAVFTPDQISEMDKSIEQDVYLDLYN